MNRSTLRWGFLSTARVNDHILKALPECSAQSAQVVASRDLEKAREYARSRNIPHAIGNYDELLRRKDVDIVYISLPNHLHLEWVLKALESGKHVLCEKPMALQSKHIEKIIEASQKTGRHVWEGFMYRSHPLTLRIREIVRSGKIGDLRFLKGSFHFTLSHFPNIRTEADKGGGALWDLGCYLVSLSRWIVGTEPQEVMGSLFRSSYSVDWSFAAQLSFPKGVFASLDCSFQGPRYKSFEVIGSSGILRIPQPFKPGPREILEIDHYEGDTVTREHIPVESSRSLYAHQLEGIGHVLRGEEIPAGTLPDLQESLGNTRTLEALMRSASSRRSEKPGLL